MSAALAERRSWRDRMLAYLYTVKQKMRKDGA